MLCKICGLNCHRRIPFLHLNAQQRKIASAMCRFDWWTSRCLKQHCLNKRSTRDPLGYCDKHSLGICSGYEYNCKGEIVNDRQEKKEV